MSKQEILITPFDEMMDMLACFSIYEGGAKQKINNENLITDMSDFLHMK